MVIIHNPFCYDSKYNTIRIKWFSEHPSKSDKIVFFNTAFTIFSRYGLIGGGRYFYYLPRAKRVVITTVFGQNDADTTSFSGQSTWFYVIIISCRQRPIVTLRIFGWLYLYVSPLTFCRIIMTPRFNGNCIYYDVGHCSIMYARLLSEHFKVYY